MSHRRIRRRLPLLLDELLSPGEEAAVRAHLEACRGCRRLLAEHEAAESLLRRIPASLIPLDAGSVGELRLRGLARWSAAPARPGRHPQALPALGALAAALALTLVVARGGHPPAAGAHEAPRQVQLAAHLSSAFLAPPMESSSMAVAYTWRQ